MPIAGQHLWEAFTELDASRNGNGYAALRLTFADIDAWARLRGIALAGWELTAIRRMDEVRVALLNDTSNAAPAKPRPSRRQMTPRLFSALFGR